MIKKTVFTYCLLISIAYAQTNNFKLTVRINGIQLKAATAQLYTFPMTLDFKGYKLDTAFKKVENNQVVFTGTMPYPHAFDGISINNEKGFVIGTLPFFVDSGNIEIIINYDSTQKRVLPIVNGSKINKEFRKGFYPKYQKIEELADKYTDQLYKIFPKLYGKNIPDSALKENTKIIDSFLTQRNAYLLKYIKQNPGSYIPLAYAGRMLLGGSYTSYAKEVFYALSSTLQNTV